MEQLSFIESFRTSPFILTEGAIGERLRHEFHISPDKHIAHAALIYDDSHREILASIYRQYLQIATEFRLPLMLMTPTRRANIEQIAASDYRHKNVLADTMASPASVTKLPLPYISADWPDAAAMPTTAATICR